MDPLQTDPASAESVTGFVAQVLLFVTCAATAYYAVENARSRTLTSHVWRYLALAGVVGALSGGGGVVELVAASTIDGANLSTLNTVRRVFQLFFVVFLALSMREIYYDLPHGWVAGEGRLPLETARRIEAALMALVFAEFVAVILFGLTTAALVVQLLASAAFTVYGVSFAMQIKTASMARGTVLDTLLTCVIAVLLCAGAATAVEVGYVAGVPAPAVASAGSVLMVMTASFLIALTVRLKQNVAAARPAAR